MSVNVAVFGAFDINSFGDLLFPKALEVELRKRIDIDKLILFSPTNNRSEYDRENTTYCYDEFEEVNKKYNFSAIIIGGGELLHNAPIEFRKLNNEKIVYANGEIWKKPLEYGKKYGIKVLVNSVGMPHIIPDEDKVLLAEADYISVRDRYSQERLCEKMEEQYIKLVPDSLWNLDEYYVGAFNAEREKLNDIIGLSKAESYVALQFGTVDQWEKVFETTLNYCKKNGHKLVVFAINWCHADKEVVEKIASKYGEECYVINRLLQTEEIINIISHADLFVGTSLHGSLVGYLSGVKVIIYNMYSHLVSKMDGLVAWTDTKTSLVENVRQLEAALSYSESLVNEIITECVSNVKAVLKCHFDEMASVILSEKVVDNASVSTELTDIQYSRSYFEWRNPEGELCYKTFIAGTRTGSYTIDEKIEFGTDAYWYLPTMGCADISVHTVGIEAINVDECGRCFDRVIKYKIPQQYKDVHLKYGLKIKSEPIELAQVMQLYWNKSAHVELLEKAEREYLSRIGDMQNSINELEINNKTLMHIKEGLENGNAELANKNAELANKNAELANKNAELANKNAELVNGKTALEEKERELTQEIRNKEGHIELLLEVEREYEREKRSKTYRLARVFRKISVALLPVNSKRRFFARLMAKTVRHPILTLKMINPRRIKNCFIILRKEGVASALNHYRLVEEYERSRSVPMAQENLDIVQVAEKEKTIEEYQKLKFSQVENPSVSIVIPVYNQFDYTYHCLESILSNSGDCTYEIIIGNDCSTDLTTRLAEVVSGIRIINNEKNLRFLLNCNNAASYAKGEYILFLNNDTQVQKDWLRPLVDLMEQQPSVGMVGSKLVYADGYLQEAGGILWNDGSAWNYGNRQNPNDSEFNYVKEADYISGAAIMIRTSLWKEIGGFDERFVPAYCEDSDLAFEVRKHGYKVMYQPKSVVVHFEGVSNGTDLTSGQKKYQVDNQKKFLEKWRDELQNNHFENGTNVFLARERSKDQKHVLVIDHYVPQYDKDAGSKTTFMYLKMLVNKGYKITFLGDNFYQHEPYTTKLQQMGIFVLYGPKYAENWKEWLRENIQYFDIFYLNRPHITVKYIDFIKEHARGKIIYYGHDLHFLRIHREYELNGDPKQLEESENWKEQEFNIMRKADMNYYPSIIEEDAVHEIDAQIPVKAITAYVYEQFKDVTYNMDERQGILFVGGFGHAPNLDAVMWFLDKIFPEIYKRVKAPFYIVGSKAPDEITQITTEGVIVKGFVSEEELQELYENSRIAVVPLRYGAGVKGKVVEALYYGIPIVTTSVGAEGIEGIEDIAVVKDNEQELIDAICEIYGNASELVRMSETSQKFVREKFSTDAVWSIIKDDFE